MRVLEGVLWLRLAAASNKVQPTDILESLRNYDSNQFDTEDIFSREAVRPPDSTASTTFISVEERFRILENEVKYLKKENQTVKKKISILEEGIDGLTQGHGRIPKDNNDNKESSEGMACQNDVEETALTATNNDEGVLVQHRNTARVSHGVETITVDASEHGASMRVLYFIARECEGITKCGDGHHTRASTIFRFEWWSRSAIFAATLQLFMVRLMEQTIGENEVDPSRSIFSSKLVQGGSFESRGLDIAGVCLALTVFLFDMINQLVGPWMRCFWAYYHMEERNAFTRHPTPVRAHFIASFLMTLEFMVISSTGFYGTIFLSQSPTKADLLLNVVALKFVTDVDDYICRVSCNLGVIRDFDVPKYVVRPSYISDPAWRKHRLFSRFGSFFRHGCLATPVFPVSIAVLVSCVGWATDNYKDVFTSGLLHAFEVFTVPGTAILACLYLPVANTWLKGFIILVMYGAMYAVVYLTSVIYFAWAIAVTLSLSIIYYVHNWRT